MTPFKDLPASEQLLLKQEAVRVEKLPARYKLMRDENFHVEVMKED